MNDEKACVTLKMTVDQAAAVTRMLDLATRIHLRQFRQIEFMARMWELRHRDGRELNQDEVERLDELMVAASGVFGFTPNASFGIGSPYVSKDAHRGWEIKKVIDKALAEHRDPNPTGIRGVNYDGLAFRVTDDPAPVATIGKE